MGSRGASSQSKSSKNYSSFLFVNSINAKNKKLKLDSYQQAKEMVNWLEKEAKKAGENKTIKFEFNKDSGSITAYNGGGFGLSKSINSFTDVGLGNWNISKKEVLKFLKEFKNEVDTKGLTIIN